jgi:spore maturation protein CgeB
MACAIPLVCSPWDDCENLFSPGEDFLFARDGDEMKRHIRDLLNDGGMANEIAERGRRKILSRHTCAHRVDQLLAILSSLGSSAEKEIAA